jgi:hypothetical protein
VDPRDGLEDAEMKKFYPYQDSNSDPSAVQPVASRYTDSAIPALDWWVLLSKTFQTLSSSDGDTDRHTGHVGQHIGISCLWLLTRDMTRCAFKNVLRRQKYFGARAMITRPAGQ